MLLAAATITAIVNAKWNQWRWRNTGLRKGCEDSRWNLERRLREWTQKQATQVPLILWDRLTTFDVKWTLRAPLQPKNPAELCEAHRLSQRIPWTLLKPRWEKSVIQTATLGRLSRFPSGLSLPHRVRKLSSRVCERF